MNREGKRYRPNGESLASTVIDGDAVLINLATGIYYSLDGVGGAAWEMIEQGRTAGEIAHSLAARYETTPAQAMADLDSLIRRLEQEQLIVERIDVPTAAAAPHPPARRQPYRRPELSMYSDMSDLLALDPPMPGLRDIPLRDQE